MYTMYRNLNLNGRIWDKPTTQNETKEADDIERIRFYRNKVCHSDASEIETPLFNKWMLDLLGVIYIRCRNVYNSIFVIQWHILV